MEKNTFFARFLAFFFGIKAVSCYAYRITISCVIEWPFFTQNHFNRDINLGIEICETHHFSSSFSTPFDLIEHLIPPGLQQVLDIQKFSTVSINGFLVNCFEDNILSSSI